MQKIERATLDQRLQHFAIGNAGIEPAAEIFQRLEVATALALANGKLHCSLADILDRSQAKADGIPVAAVYDRRFPPCSRGRWARPSHHPRQFRRGQRPRLQPPARISTRSGLRPVANRNAHPFAFAHQDRDFFGIIDFVREQTSHEFDRMVRL